LGKSLRCFDGCGRTGEDRFGPAFELVLMCNVADRTVQTHGIVMIHKIGNDGSGVLK